MPTSLSGGPEQLLLELLAIFVSAKIFAAILERISLPAVPGEILAGMVLGPFAFGWVPQNDALNAIAEIGAIFILFSTGLETSPRDLIRVSRKALVVSVVGVLAPFILGFGYMSLRGAPTIESVFIAAAMVATSVGITARVLSEMKVLSERTSQIILAAAVFDDVLGMLVLAVVTGSISSTGVSWVHLGIVTAEAIAFAVFMMFLAPQIVRQFRPRMDRLPNQNGALIVALSICLIFSWLATKIGMAAIVGAFFAGLMFAEHAPRWNLVERVGGTAEFLAPFFFFDIGARFNPHLLTGTLLTGAIIISLLAIVSKLIGCGLPLLGEGWPTVLKVGIGMTPRGEVALIVALVGLQSKILSSSAYGIIVLMTIVTTLLAPPALRYLFHVESKPVPKEPASPTVSL